MARYIDDADLIILETENKKLKEENARLKRELEEIKAYCDMMHELADKQAEKLNTDSLGGRYIRDIFMTR